MLAEYAVLEEDVGFNADNALDYGVNSWSSGLFPLRIRWPINIVPAKPAETKRCQQHAYDDPAPKYPTAARHGSKVRPQREIRGLGHARTFI